MNNSLWHKLGFSENPYDTKPLNVIEADVDLLLGRESEQIEFLTSIESSNEGVFVISGVPGVGKTSFLNIQQYLIESGRGFGGKILSARSLCSVQPSDEAKHLAIRSLQSYTKSIQQYCENNSKKLPKQVEKVISWLHQNKPATFEFGFQILGNGINYGKETHLPNLNEATFETLTELLQTLSLEVQTELNFEGSFIVLDNIENLHEDDLSDLLVSFRDTLFNIKGIWWVLIGQSGLSSLIQSTNPKVYQRLTGGMELKPITIENLIKAVNIRVDKFHNTSNIATSPISEDVYIKLFKCSNGEIRFVFKYCIQICITFVQTIRKFMTLEKIQIDDDSFNDFMGRYMVETHIKDEFALRCLRDKILEEFAGLYLLNEEKGILKKIGELEKIKPKDYAQFSQFGIKTLQDFSSNYLTRFASQNLLLRRQEGKVVTYELRGIAFLALEFEIIE
ncbi:AAA family ATPase [Empedobacter sp. UBA4754]|uniref:AAA family ATPase n=1 Tax=Empedobacter sp. UBA4754 TaxID=1946437 RepID=UPI0025B83F6E|nr:AAA family ATPase [Empedobacter sp. UBA4754]